MEKRSLILVPVSLPLEDVQVIALRGIVLARCDEGKLSETGDAYEQSSWSKQTGVVSVRAFAEDMHPVPVTLALLDDVASSGSAATFDTIEIIGAHLDPNLTQRLKECGYEHLEDTELGCNGSRVAPGETGH